MSSKKTFIMYESWGGAVEKMTAEQAGSLLKAIYAYQSGHGADPDDPAVSLVWELIKQKFDEDRESYEETCRKRADAGRSGNTKRWSESQKVANASQKSQKVANAINESQKVANVAESESDSESDSDKDIKTVVDDYNATCRSLPRAKTMSQARRRMIRARLRKYSLDDIHKAFEMSEASDFLTGRSGKWGGANIDWILGEANIAKILDGNYANSTARASPANKGIEHDPRNDDMVKALFGGL